LAHIFNWESTLYSSQVLIVRFQSTCKVCMKIIRVLRAMWNGQRAELELGNFRRVMLSTVCKAHPEMFSCFFSGNLYNASIIGFSVPALRPRGCESVMIRAITHSTGLGFHVWGVDIIVLPFRNNSHRKGQMSTAIGLAKSFFDDGYVLVAGVRTRIAVYLCRWPIVSYSASLAY